ncbi:unnamed protein product [Gongylonema pulchrum]|uniref:FAT domain-containing protein n=1 Tax=Gongylonema pulchrum TaxID=637853 RepID=A0A183D334_9BILA|nr:unnamed protein product [Gongylonema pulchrum]
MAYVHLQYDAPRSSVGAVDETHAHGHPAPPERFSMNWKCHMVMRHQEFSLDDCLLSLGSQNLFIFLFAQAIDKQHDGNVQALALRVLLQFLGRITPSMWVDSLTNIYRCIARCLSSPLAQLDDRMLQVCPLTFQADFFV